MRGKAVGRATRTLIGAHQGYDALAALAVGVSLGVPSGEMSPRLAEVGPLDKRLRPIDLGGVTFYNDAYKTYHASAILFFLWAGFLIS